MKDRAEVNVVERDEFSFFLLLQVEYGKWKWRHLFINEIIVSFGNYISVLGFVERKI